MNDFFRRLAVIALASTLLLAVPALSHADCAQGPTVFQAGSYIIPMDTAYQDDGMFVAFGLLHQVLKSGVPVDWAIQSGKDYGDVDFSVAAVTDVRSNNPIGNAVYRGGPFVIDSQYAVEVQPIIAQWLTANPGLTVHEADTTFVADVGRSLLTAPDIAVFADDNEDIAFRYMNAAAVPQALRKPGRPGNRVVAGAASAAPVVSSAPAGHSLVSGTSSEAAGSVVQVFVNGLFAGTASVQAGGTWTFGPIAIPPSINVTAAVTGSGKGTSPLSGNRASGTLPLGGTSAAPTIVGPIRDGELAVYGTSTEANGTSIKVFRNGVLEGTTTVAASRWSWPPLAPIDGGDTWTATATASAKTESRLGNFVIAVPVPATVTPNVTAGDTSVAGLYKMANDSPVAVMRTRGATTTVIGTDTVHNLAWSIAPAAGVIAAGDRIWAEPTAFPWPGDKDGSHLYACPGQFCCPECLGEDAIKGASLTDHQDGRLFDPAGQPRFCQIMSMHYSAPGDTEVVAEVRSFLRQPTHAFFECQAVNAFENVATGHYLTTNGLVTASVAGGGPFFYFGQDSPFAQADGTYNNPGGSEKAYSLASGSAYHNANVVHLSGADVPGHGVLDVWMTGFLDGNTANGKVSFLGGHSYETDLPVSTHPKSVGTRYFLDSLYEAPCVCQAASVTVVKSGPAQVFTSNVTYTINYQNAGNSFANNVVISDTIPVGSTFVSATPPGVFAAGKVSWVIGGLAVGAAGSVQVTVSLPTPGVAYTDVARASFEAGQLTRESQPSSVTTFYCDQNQVLPEVDAPPQSGLRCVKVNGADVRITWTDALPTTACGVTYRIYGATGPTCPVTLAPYGLLGSTMLPTFDHTGVVGDGQTWWYLVVMSNGFTNGRFDTYYGP